MNSEDGNSDLIPAPKKLQWISPQILDMQVMKTYGKFPFHEERTAGVGAGWGGPGSVAGASWPYFRIIHPCISRTKQPNQGCQSCYHITTIIDWWHIQATTTRWSLIRNWSGSLLKFTRCLPIRRTQSFSSLVMKELKELKYLDPPNIWLLQTVTKICWPLSRNWLGLPHRFLCLICRNQGASSLSVQLKRPLALRLRPASPVETFLERTLQTLEALVTH